MHPILFRVGDFPIHSYGFLIAVGFLLCVWVGKREAERNGIAGEKIVDLGFWSLLIGMLGARLLYVITRASYFADHPVEIFYIWEGGLVFWGGILACVPFFLWYTQRHQMPRWVVLDLSATSVPLAHAFGRLGCFSAGCCYGHPTGTDWGVKFYSPLVERHLQGINLHPTQLYEAASLFVLFFFLRWLRRHKSFEGQLLLAYFMIYSVIRSIIEIFRGDQIRGFVIDGVLSTSQFISLLVIIASSAVYWRLYQRRRKQACSSTGSPASA